MSETECTCDLVEISTLLGEPAFVRGWSRGCVVHPAGEYEQRIMAEQAEWDAKVKAAEQAAREAR